MSYDFMKGGKLSKLFCVQKTYEKKQKEEDIQ